MRNDNTQIDFDSFIAPVAGEEPGFLWVYIKFRLVQA